MRKFFASNATRDQLPADVVEKLDSIRQSGNGLLNALKPYQDASVFSLQFCEGSYKRAKDEGESESHNAVRLFREGIKQCRLDLDKADTEIIKKIFKASKADDKDIQTTSAISAFFFLGGLAKYCPELIFESVSSPKEKNKLAKGFVKFFEKHASAHMDITKKREVSVKKFHGEVFAIYNAFKEEFPEFFDELREKLWTSQGEFMAEYGSFRFSMDWPGHHYEGRL
jgi:hypothetical protein